MFGAGVRVVEFDTNETVVSEKGITFGTIPGKRRQGGQKKQWLDDITQWSGQSLVDMVRLAEDRQRYRRFIHEVAHAR